MLLVMPLLPPQPAPQTLRAVAAAVQSTIDSTIPFIESDQGDIFLVPLPEGPTPADIHYALADLVRTGGIRDYRYLEAGPAPAVLAVTAAA
jgi:hypothetical protein